MGRIYKQLPRQMSLNPVYKVLEIDHSDYEDETFYDSNEREDAKEAALQHAKNSWDKGDGGFKYVSVTEIYVNDEGIETYNLIYERDYSYGPDIYPEDYE